jgi:hypothetical protein
MSHRDVCQCFVDCERCLGQLALVALHPSKTDNVALTGDVARFGQRQLKDANRSLEVTRRMRVDLVTTRNLEAATLARRLLEGIPEGISRPPGFHVH